VWTRLGDGVVVSIDHPKDVTDEAIERVERHADHEWMAVAYNAVVSIAEQRPEFTTDALWTVLRRNHPGVVTHERRAVGRS
jgi:hypothetical protein